MDQDSSKLILSWCCLSPGGDLHWHRGIVLELPLDSSPGEELEISRIGIDCKASWDREHEDNYM